MAHRVPVDVKPWSHHITFCLEVVVVSLCVTDHTLKISLIKDDTRGLRADLQRKTSKIKEMVRE